jgi:hypothetical protein
VNQRGQIQSIITEIRGRLDELEALARVLPRSPVLTPASFDEPGVRDLTPESYRSFRANGLPAPATVSAFDRSLGFFQVTSKDRSLPLTFDSFELSDLHKSGAAPAFGLQIVPCGSQQVSMKYAFMSPAAEIVGCEWTEWVLKLSTSEPCELSVFALAAGSDFVEKLTLASIRVNEFASFAHIRIPGAKLRNALDGRQPDEVRLLLGTDGRMIPLRVYGFSVFGKV